MGEKDLFHEVSVRVLRIIFDPGPKAAAPEAPLQMPSSKPSS